MERVLEELEHRCHENMTHAMETEEGLGIEYDEDVVCDVCQSPDGEDNNEMVFCDKCNICVHQVSFSDRTCLLLAEGEELVGSSSRPFVLAPKLLSAVVLVLLQTEVQRLPPLPPPPHRRVTAFRRSQRAAGSAGSVPSESCQSASCVLRRAEP